MHTDVFGASMEEHERTALRVPATSIYSRLDGVVPWQACLDVHRPEAENLRVDSSHCGMAFHPTVLRIILDRLAQPETVWNPIGTY
jgi:hypothetical protein